MPSINDIKELIRQKCMSDMGAMFSEEKFESMSASYLAGITKRMSDEEFAQGFMEQCPHPFAELKDYSARIIPLNGDAWAMVSLRFMGMNPNVPFILIEYCTLELIAENIPAILNQVAQQYQHLQINRYGFAAKELPNEIDDWKFQIDKVHVRSAISKQDDEDDFIQLINIPSVSDAEYQRYEQEYQKYLKDNAILQGQLFYETKNFLNELGTAGNLYRVEINGNYAGIVAVTEIFEQYFYGFGVMEEFLFEACRGKGYGKIIQRKMINKLSDDGHDCEYLFGSISIDNIVSQRTAAANGRHPFMNSYFASKK